MCGICGVVYLNSEKATSEDLQTMMSAMKHRGPDDGGFFIDQSTGLGHVRLSIIDLTPAGHQPMFSEDGSLVLIFNGEIYNYLELKEELSPDYSFRTKTDSEVILAAYRRWGRDCLHHFNGMFAFVLYDKTTREFFAARDRFGVKPFYYYADGARFVFASEIKPLLKVLGRRPSPDDQTIYDFLVLNRTDYSERTFFKEIKKLPHGHSLTIKNGRLHIERWYHLASSVRPAGAGQNILRDLLVDSIGLRLRSDVPVGACLSGGLDSSSIVSIIAGRYHKKDLHTFSAVYGKGRIGDETAYIECLQDKVGSMHFARPAAADLLKQLKSFIETIEEPIPGTSAYAEFKVYELAKDTVTVILNGQGPDEVMAGYNYFSGYLYKELFNGGKLAAMVREMAGGLIHHRRIRGLGPFFYFMLSDGWKAKLHGALARPYLKKDFTGRFGPDRAVIHDLYGAGSLHEAFLSHMEYKFEHNLVWGDKNSMHFSMEARYPFLDYRWVETALSLSNTQVLKNGTSKRIFREAMAGIVPEKILNRYDKIGYETPEDQWLRDKDLSAFVWEVFRSEAFGRRGYVDPQAAARLYQKHLDGRVNAALQIWKWLHLELWFRTFLD